MNHATMFRGALALLMGAFGLALPRSGAAGEADALTSLIAKLRVEEASEFVRQRPQWRKPQKIVLLDFGSERWSDRREALASVAPQAQFVAVNDTASAINAAANADVIIGFNPEICDPKIINNARELRWLASLAAGVERCMAVPAVHDRNLLVTNMRGVDSAAIAEHAIALALALAHGLDRFAVATSNRIWTREDAETTPMQVLRGKNLLVVGLGGIGTEVAMRAHALGMKVTATRAGEHARPEFVSYVGRPDELLALARSADVIVSSVPLTPQTKGMYDAKFFSVLKPTAYFINVARGGSVVTADLVKALNDKRLAGAGLDVTDPEPLPRDNPLWRAPRVIITPHVSSRSDLPDEARWLLVKENLRRYAAGDKMLSVVDLKQGY